MAPILSKAQMSEEDIKLQYITPAIISKWSTECVTMETQITDGKINLRGNLAVREKPKKADYVLYLNAYHPVAVVEAKDTPTFIIEPFVYQIRLFFFFFSCFTVILLCWYSVLFALAE